MDRAYWSRLTISFGPEGEILGLPKPGPVNDTNDPELERLLRLAVRPVVESLITPDELESLSLHREDWADPRVIWVNLTACGETFYDTITDPAWEGHETPDPVRIAARVADHLEDWICETRFAWGEQRVASYSLPLDGP